MSKDTVENEMGEKDFNTISGGKTLRGGKHCCKFMLVSVIKPINPSGLECKEAAQPVQETCLLNGIIFKVDMKCNAKQHPKGGVFCCIKKAKNTAMSDDKYVLCDEI